MKIFFTGTGPGDPELITVKAKKIIRQADVIIYAGSLVNKKLLDWKKKGAKVYNSAEMTLEEIYSVYRKSEQAGMKIVVRLHTGDPSLYGAIQEQMGWCDREGIEYEVIPGVSSFCAASAAMKQELTLPGISQTVIISREGARTKCPSRENIRRLARIRATLILFLSVDKIGKITKKLITGYPKGTPVTVCFRASWPDEIIVKGTLADISEKVRDYDIKRQALIFVGDVLKKKGFKKTKLYNKSFSHMYRDGQ